jgi:hypothetical protein
MVPQTTPPKPFGGGPDLAGGKYDFFSSQTYGRRGIKYLFSLDFLKKGKL